MADLLGAKDLEADRLIMSGQKPLDRQNDSPGKNPVSWLLESSDPSIRYWTMVDVLGYPEDAPIVVDTKMRLVKQPIVLQLLELQQPNGHWGEDETKPYTAKGTLGVLSLLYQLGFPGDERTSAGCNSFLHFCQDEGGGFSMVKTRKSGIFPCTTGEHLPFLVQFGFGDDARVHKAFDYLLESMSSVDALNCGRYQHQECLWGAIAALKGLLVLPADMRGSRSDQVVGRLADALLQASYDFSGEHRRWLTFGVPRAWDLISALYVLALHGFTAEPVFEKLLEHVLEVQDGQGRWLCGSVSQTWPLEKRNQPSKWVTLDVLRLLKVAGHTFSHPA
jgi:hypothetical protein